MEVIFIKWFMNHLNHFMNHLMKLTAVNRSTTQPEQKDSTKLRSPTAPQSALSSGLVDSHRPSSKCAFVD
jgi:hypothetical protein